jgi:Fanconi anemia group M protein
MTEHQKFVVTADMREQRSGVVSLLERSPLIEVLHAELPVGDYVLSESVVVERKEATDFVNSIMDRRLFGQIAQMKATYARPVLLLEGDVFATRSAISAEALHGALSWLSVIEGISVVHSRGVNQTAALLETMARHANEGLGYDLALRGAKPKNLKVLAQYAVEGLPGCGPGTAKKLLDHFGSVGAVFAASEADLCGVRGIGKKSAAQIRELIDHPV